MFADIFSRAGPRPELPAAPADCVIYAVGDIHGRVDLLDRLHRKIALDAAGRRESRKLLIYLGDYVDRGPRSRQVLDRLTAPADDGIERIHLKGNHEDAMMRFLEEGSWAESWLGFGGLATLASYGVELHAAGRGREDRLAELRRRLLDRVPARHRAFLDGLAPCHMEGEYFFAHAGARPGVPLERQAAEDLMWIRDEFLHARRPLGKVVVHGHTIERRPVVRRHRIGIDTGAFATGVLTALVLAGRERRFLQTP